MRNFFFASISLLLVTGCGSAQIANTWISPQTFHENSPFVEEGEDDPAVLEDAGPTYSVDDCLTIKMAPDKSKVYYSFHLNFAYGHVCAMAGMAQAAGPNTWVHEFSLADGTEDRAESSCRLILTEEDGAWSIQDDANCGMEFCGARGYIGHSFQASQKGPLSKCGWGENE